MTPTRTPQRDGSRLRVQRGMRHIVTLMTRVEREPGWACALRSEQLLAHSARVLGPAESLGAAKVLLVRAAGDPGAAPRTVDLVPVVSVQQWRHYEVQRIAVEAGFGVGAREARRMVRELRDRGERLGLRLYFAQDCGQVVGAMGCFRLPVPHQSYARLQEVDVFPGWRGQGYGDGLLTAVLAMLNAEGVSTVVVGADEDDWPLSWYRRRGFRDTVRVSLDR